jgi:hypothetical protein
MRKLKYFDKIKKVIYKSKNTKCIYCGGNLKYVYYAWRKNIVTLEGPIRVISYAYKCQNPATLLTNPL